MYQKNRFFSEICETGSDFSSSHLNSQNFIITTFKTHQILCLGKMKNLVCLMNIIYLSNVQKIGFSNKGTNLWDTFFIKIWAFFGMFGLLNDVIFRGNLAIFVFHELYDLWGIAHTKDLIQTLEIIDSVNFFRQWNHIVCFDLTPCHIYYEICFGN